MIHLRSLKLASIISVIEKLQPSIYPLGEAQVYRVKRFYMALMGVLLCHVSLFFIFEKALKNTALLERLTIENHPIIMELDSFRYVEVNPEVAENMPDKSKNYSFKNQQAADSLKSIQDSPIPYSEGTVEDTLKIVQGDLAQEEISINSGDFKYTKRTMKYPSVPQPSAKAKRLEVSNKSDPIDKPIPMSGTGSSLVKTTDLELSSQSSVTGSEERIIPLTRDFSKYAGINDNTPAQETKTNRPIPMTRPKLATNITEAPLMRSYTSAHRIGAVSLDATFSKFGEYEKQFYAALQLGWFNEVEFFKPMDSGTVVQVAFILKSNGTIEAIKVIGTNASFLATTICENAIRKRSPFRPWTEEMVQVFGEKKELKVKFYYR